MGKHPTIISRQAGTEQRGVGVGQSTQVVFEPKAKHKKTMESICNHVKHEGAGLYEPWPNKPTGKALNVKTARGRNTPTGKDRQREKRKNKEAFPRVPVNGLPQEVQQWQGRPRSQAEKVCVSRCCQASSKNTKPRKWGGVHTHSMGFPLISDMMELSPPRYS